MYVQLVIFLDFVLTIRKHGNTETRTHSLRCTKVSRLRSYFDSGMETRTTGYVLLDRWVCDPSTLFPGPRTLCNACGLVYAKLVMYFSPGLIRRLISIIYIIHTIPRLRREVGKLVLNRYPLLLPLVSRLHHHLFRKKTPSSQLPKVERTTRIRYPTTPIAKL